VKRSPAHEASELLVELLLTLKKRMVGAADEVGLSFPQFNLLGFIPAGEGVPMKALAEATGADASNITGLCDKLEARGLVERRLVPHDRRVKLLCLTRAGEQLRARVMERLSEPPAWMTALSASEQRQLRDLLRRSKG
jgi:DNA-binding MarR family transcriptional regulator